MSGSRQTRTDEAWRTLRPNIDDIQTRLTTPLPLEITIISNIYRKLLSNLTSTNTPIKLFILWTAYQILNLRSSNSLWKFVKTEYYGRHHSQSVCPQILKSNYLTVVFVSKTLFNQAYTLQIMALYHSCNWRLKTIHLWEISKRSHILSEYCP